MRLKVVALALALIAIVGTVGLSAFTVGEVRRSANIDVAADSQGLIDLDDGTSGNLVHPDPEGELDIDFTANGTVTGPNLNGRFVLGNESSATTQYAFSITNRDAETHDITLNYTLASSTADSSTSDNVIFETYNSTGSPLVAVSEQTGSQTITSVAQGETVYVVVVVDTRGNVKSDDLSGTLGITADN